tara:strand:+ start:229 stop:1224 length:996 start_codon:yes stop_codon:yes gene_type:complete
MKKTTTEYRDLESNGNNAPRSLSDLSRKELDSLWSNFLWELVTNDKLENEELKKYLGEYIFVNEFCDYLDLDKHGTFISINHPNNPLPFQEGESFSSDEEGKEIVETFKVFQMTFNIAVERKDFVKPVQYVLKKFKKECCSTIRELIKRENLAEYHCLGYEEIEYNFKLINTNAYKSYGYTYEKLWKTGEQLSSNKTPDLIYQFRELDMSMPHIKLAQALRDKGFLIACEAAVFPKGRIDKSYIRPDLIVFHKSRCLFVEVDGPSHWQKVDRKGTPIDPPEPVKDQFKKDRERDRMFASNGFTVMRFTTDEAQNRTSKCIFEIIEYFNSAG